MPVCTNFLSTIGREAAQFPRAAAAPSTHRASPHNGMLRNRVGIYTETGAGTSDQSFIMEILGLEDTVADEDSPKFYWDDLVQMNEAAQARCLLACMRPFVHTRKVTHPRRRRQ